MARDAYHGQQRPANRTTRPTFAARAADHLLQVRRDRDHPELDVERQQGRGDIEDTVTGRIGRILVNTNPLENRQAQRANMLGIAGKAANSAFSETDSFDRKMTGLLLIRTETLGFFGALLASSIDFAPFPPMFCFNAARDQIRFRQMDRGST